MSHDIIRSAKYHTQIYNPGSGFEASMTTSSRPIQITANRLKPLQFHDDVNNCTDDNARDSEGKSGPLSKPDRASRPTPVWGKHQSKAKERPGSIFRKAGVQKRKKGCAYLSPRIERKATDARESCSRLTLHTDVVTNSLDVQSEMTTALKNLKSSDTDCRHNPNKSTSAEKTHARGVRVRSSDKKISKLERKSKLRSAEFRQDAEQKQPENAKSAEENENATGESVQGAANRDSRSNPYCTVQVEKEVYEGKVPSVANSTHQRGGFWTSLSTILKPHEDDPITDERTSTPQDSDATKGLLHPSLKTEASVTPDPVSVGSFLSSDEQGDLRADFNVPPTKPYTIDKFKVKQILDILRDSYTTPVEGKGPGLNGLGGRSDSSLATDLKCIEQELSAIVELDSLRKKPEVQGSGFWKSKTKESKQDRKEERSFEGFQRAQKGTASGRRGQGDCELETVPTISQDKLSEINERRSVSQPRKEVVCTAPKQNELRFRSTSSKRRKEMDSETTCGETPGRNTNESMSRSQSSAEFNIPALQPHKWRCRSAPELRHPLSRLEPVRRVSQYDVTIAHRCDVKGPYIMEVCSDSDYESVPSLLWGEEAYRHYKLLTMIETKEKIQMIKDAKATIVTKYMWKQRVLENLVDVAKAYYSDPTKDKRREWKRLREEIHHSKDHSMTDVRNTLASLPNFWPLFTFFLMMAQAVCVVAMSSADGLAPAPLNSLSP
ncbi:uncharacterized protein [Littorina saxatilis]|uniref:uncharacterized protein n=1 Tax=Littorina saxatilis TaxID=31220 RepID=UPI0038B420A5